MWREIKKQRDDERYKKRRRCRKRTIVPVYWSTCLFTVVIECISGLYTSYENTPMPERERVCMREMERGVGGGRERGPSERNRERERERETGRECRKSQHITGRTRGKVVIRIALVPRLPPPHTSKLLSFSSLEQHFPS